MTPPLEREGHAPDEVLAERRRMLATALAAGQWAVDPVPVEERIAGVRCLRYESQSQALQPLIPSEVEGQVRAQPRTVDVAPSASRLRSTGSLDFDREGRSKLMCGHSAHPTILHAHGGGFALGCAEMSGPFARALADATGADVVSVDYRLAPEHPFPAGLNDVLAVARAIKGPLILSGDSAGGGLAAAVATLVPAEALILLSAWLDLTVTHADYQNNAASDPLFSSVSARTAAANYLQGVDPRHPLASPLFATPEAFPPSFVSIGTGEVLAGDGRALHAKLTTAGVPATLSAIDGMTHVAVTRDATLPGAAETLAALAAFVQDRLA